MNPIEVVLVGEFRPNDVVAHRGIAALVEQRADVRGRWLRTDEVGHAEHTLSGANAIWCVPGSPYANMDGALAAIRFARERAIPFLGTCGGFQHAVIEFARSVLGVTDAAHAETSPLALTQVMVPLDCPLRNVEAEVRLVADSRLARAYGALRSAEEYQCSFGLDESWRERLERAGLRFTAFDEHGRVRAIELPAHPFFVGTLFQPERRALRQLPSPLVNAFFAAAKNREEI